MAPLTLSSLFRCVTANNILKIQRKWLTRFGLNNLAFSKLKVRVVFILITGGTALQIQRLISDLILEYYSFICEISPGVMVI